MVDDMWVYIVLVVFHWDSFIIYYFLLILVNFSKFNLV